MIKKKLEINRGLLKMYVQVGKLIQLKYKNKLVWGGNGC